MAYASVAEAREWLSIDDSYDDSTIALALTSAEDAVTEHCGWRFDSVSATYVFHANSSSTLDLGALPLASSSITLKTDDNADGVYETTWASTDYQLEPLNGVGPNGLPGWPYTTIRGIDRAFPMDGNGRPGVQIVGTFGWAAVPDNVKLASIMTAGWVWTAKATPSGVMVTEFGPVSVRQVPQAERLLRVYRRGTAIVGMA